MLSELSTPGQLLPLRLLTAGQVWVLRRGTLDRQVNFSVLLLCVKRGSEQTMLGDFVMSLHQVVLILTCSGSWY